MSEKCPNCGNDFPQIANIDCCSYAAEKIKRIDKENKLNRAEMEIGAIEEQLRGVQERVKELEERIDDALNIPFPYPKSIFKMTVDEYIEAVPDPKLRTSISGLLMGDGWEGAMRQVKEALEKR